MVDFDLHKFLPDIKDITEPACMETLLMYLDERRMEDDDFMTILIENIGDTTIYWAQPWYQQCPTSITRPLKMQDDVEEPFRTDSFSKEEDLKLEKNWRKFVKKYRIPDKPRSFATWRNRQHDHRRHAPVEKARQFVTAYLARGLERSLYQVYRHVVSLYGAQKKGDYSELELKIMDVCFYHCPNNAVVYASEILSREPRGIYKRLMISKDGGPEKKRMKWTLEKASTFLNSLIRHTGLPPKKLKYKHISKETWLEVEKDMKHCYVHLRSFWYGYLHVQLFVKHNVKMRRLRRKVLDILSRYPYLVWTDIRWKQVLTHFPDGFTHMFLYKIIHILIRRTLSTYLQVPLDEVISHARSKLKSFPNRRLRTLALDKSGQLQVVRHKQNFEVL